MDEKVIRKEVCRCENCGNEAEMTVVCEVVPTEAQGAPEGPPKRREKRTFTCVSCGSEADMIVDL
ncbi:hypothetical protein [Deferrisoma palaeochoriense]